jgi:hypothetical protein
MTLSWINARKICKNNGNGHCNVWTSDEAILVTLPLIIFCSVCASLGIPVFIPNFGGQGALKFFDIFSRKMRRISDDNFHKLIIVENRGTHISNYDWWRAQNWPNVGDQLEYVYDSVSVMHVSLRNFFHNVVAPACKKKNIPPPPAPDYRGDLIHSNRAMMVVDPNNSNIENIKVEIISKVQTHNAKIGSTHRREASGSIDCSVPDCGRAARSSGKCKIHHQKR